MSYINKPGKTTAWQKMVRRQQVSAMIANGQIITTHHKAKESQRHIERIITVAKQDTLEHRRQAEAILLDTAKYSKKELINKLFKEIAPKYMERSGGYTRVLKLGKRPGDNTEEAIIQFV